MTKLPAVYMMASMRNGTIYVGITSDLAKRAWQHREGLAEGFTKQYDCKLLVWFERHDTMESAIMREKQIKAGNRKAKLSLIESENPTWRDLFEDIAH
ncbi:GIY-YIG nuclease family protein [Erythrobacter sp.]|uniref:GIY-YIG nuclease family protein n=1 Tax=Erythrobacter sp. TaxID=1042 RepID=UPI0025EEDE61|nr:GIY-YIG nuclease family protein [Erythrobacter sp.]